MIKTLKILWSKTNKKRKYQFLFLSIAVFLSSLSEIVSLSSVIPFTTALLNPENLLNTNIFKYVPFDLSRFSTDFLILLSTLSLILFAFVSSILKISVLGIIRLWAANFGTDIGSELYEKILYQPYEKHIKIDSSQYIAVVTGDTNDFVNELVVPLLNLISSIFIALSILITLLLINGLFTIYAFLIILIFYLFALNVSRNYLKRLSYKKVFYRELVIKNIQEGMGSIKDIILNNNYQFFINLFRNLDRSLRMVGARIFIFSNTPLEPLIALQDW